MVRRLFHVNAHNDIDALLEIHGLMEEIRQAWKSVPSLIAPKKDVKVTNQATMRLTKARLVFTGQFCIIQY